MLKDLNPPKNMYQMVYDWARYANRDLGKSLDKKKVGVTMELVRSRKFRVEGSGDDVQKAIFSFLEYGKFVDMGVGKGQKLGDVKGNQVIYKETGIKGRKAKKWYSKVIFPEANTLAKLLEENYGLKITSELNESLDDAITLSL